jgi:hypothetical protein
MTPFSAKRLEAAVMDTLDLYMGVYLDTFAPGTAYPASITRRNTIDNWVEEQLPCMIVASIGLVGEAPAKRGGGARPIYTLPFGVGIGTVVSAATQTDTRDVAQDYCACVRHLILQYQKLGLEDGVVEEVIYVDERYNEMVDQDHNRTLLAGTVFFTVLINDKMGPKPPALEDPWGRALVDVIAIPVQAEE